MAKRGPKPRPAALKLAGGTPAPRPAAPAIAGRPECPGHLDAIARAEWDRIVPLLDEAGILARIDGAALAIYCATYSRWVRASAELDAPEGLVAYTEKGGVKQSPYVQIAAAAERDMARMLVEFGCTPSSRSRVATKAEGPKDAFAEFLAKRKA